MAGSWLQYRTDKVTEDFTVKYRNKLCSWILPKGHPSFPRADCSWQFGSDGKCEFTFEQYNYDEILLRCWTSKLWHSFKDIQKNPSRTLKFGEITKKTKLLILYLLLYSSKIWCSTSERNLNPPFSPTNWCPSFFCLMIRKKKGFKKVFFFLFHSSLQNSLLFSFSIFIWPTFARLPPKDTSFSSFSPSLLCNHAAWTGTPRGGLRGKLSSPAT